MVVMTRNKDDKVVGFVSSFLLDRYIVINKISLKKRLLVIRRVKRIILIILVLWLFVIDK